MERQAFENALLNALPVAVLAADSDQRTTLTNAVARRWMEAGGAAGDGEDLPANFVTPDCGLYAPGSLAALSPEEMPLGRAFRERAVHTDEVVLQTNGRAARTVSCVGAPIVDEQGRSLGAVVVMSDITEQHALQRHLTWSATHDDLTGLPNRALLMDVLQDVLSADGEAWARAAVLFCDLDRFKAVNDVFGHAAGDAVLREVSNRLQEVLRPGDVLARLGGDEFVVVCPGVPGLAAAEAVARRCAGVSVSLTTEDRRELTVGVSVGLVMSEPGDDADGLLVRADRAMYDRKRSKRAPGPEL